MKTGGLYNQKILKWLDGIFRKSNGLLINIEKSDKQVRMFEVIISTELVGMFNNQWAYREVSFDVIIKQLTFDLGLQKQTRDNRMPNLMKWDFVKREYIGGVEI